MISYEMVRASSSDRIVRLDGKHVGDIRTVEGGFQYFPKGQKTGGEVYPTLAACKRSLEGDEA